MARTISLGPASQPKCVDSAQRVIRTSLGLSVGRSEGTLGYARSDLVCLPTGTCSAIFLVEGVDQLGELRRLFPNVETACVRLAEDG